MSRLNGVLHSLRMLLRPSVADAETADEVAFHLEKQTEKLIASGLDPIDARQQALRDFGGVSRWRQETRDETRGKPLNDLVMDVQYAWRRICRAPGFSLVAIAITAIGIGAATSAATVAQHVLYRALPFPDADRLVIVSEATAKGDGMLVSFPNFESWREQSRTMTSMAAIATLSNQPLIAGASVFRGRIQVVSREFFDTFGIRPIAGRTIRADENAAGGPNVAVVSEGLWRSYLGARAIDSSLTLKLLGQTYAVVGVMPGDFNVLAKADVWLAGEVSPVRVRGAGNYQVIGRMTTTATEESARRELNAIAASLKAQYGDESISSAVVMRSLLDEVVDTARKPLLILLGAALFVLVVTAASVAIMQLARSASRDREIAVRRALGASAFRLARQVVTENLLLAVLGSTGGVMLAWMLLGLVRRYGKDLIPRVGEVQPDLFLLTVAVAAGVLTVVASGLGPVLRVARGSAPVGDSLRTRAVRSRGGNVFVGMQAAVSVLLLVGASLLTRSIYNVLSADLGYDREQVVTATVPLASSAYNEVTSRVAAAERIRSLMVTIPGVQETALSSHLPWQRGGNRGPIMIPPFGDAKLQSSWASIASLRVISPNYFTTLRIPVLQGRALNDADDASSRNIVVNASLAKKLWPGQSALGRELRALVDASGKTFTVVGVVADARDWRSANGEQQELYLTIAQQPQAAWQLNVVMRTNASPSAVVAESMRRFREVDAELSPVVASMDDSISDTIADRRLIAGIILTFTTVVLLLTVAGVFGTVAYTVDQRRREIGIRMAIGATRREVWLMVQRGILVASVTGCAIGMLVAFQAGQVLESLLYGVTQRDPMVFVVSGVIASAAIAFAAAIPAFRASRIDPTVAIRAD
jgi:putative ABC transport system permease protein